MTFQQTLCVILYCMSDKSCPFLYSECTKKIDFLNILYAFLALDVNWPRALHAKHTFYAPEGLICNFRSMQTLLGKTVGCFILA